MPRSKKHLDSRKRRTKKSVLRHSSSKKLAENKIGRPGIDREELLQTRDEVLQLLGTNWGRIGWRLSRARSQEAVRKALRPLKRDMSLSHWVASFLRTSTEKATAVQIRETGKALFREWENGRAIQEKYNLLSRKYDEVESASNLTTDGTKQSIATEFNRRQNEFEECERELFASNCKLTDLEEKLADQRAYFVQNELLRFKARGYAHNPKVLANASAGLPGIGCRHSFRICSKADSPLWPFQNFEAFKFIQRTWERRPLDSEQGIVDLFRDAIFRLPRTIKIGKHLVQRFKLKSTFQDNGLRTFLRENWRFLRLAINQVSIHKIHPKVVPYLISTRFLKNIGKPRNSQDVVLAEMEMLKD